MLSRQVEVQFMCRVAVHECGNFYSIVWYEVTLYSVICSHCIIFLILYYVFRYRETGSREAQAGQERVYVYRHHSGVAKVEDSHLTNSLTV